MCVYILNYNNFSTFLLITYKNNNMYFNEIKM